MSEKLNIEEQIEIIDNNLEVIDWNIRRAEALDKLLEMDEFHLVFTEGYLEVEAQRVFSLLVHPLTVKPEDEKKYLNQLDTIKNISRYFGTSEYKGTIKILANNSKKDKEELIQQKQELLARKGE